jgi:hypothetical protein
MTKVIIIIIIIIITIIIIIIIIMMITILIIIIILHSLVDLFFDILCRTLFAEEDISNIFIKQQQSLSHCYIFLFFLLKSYIFVVEDWILFKSVLGCM